jgi:hypothetical protein
LAQRILPRVTAKDATTQDIESIKQADFAVRSSLHALAAQGRKPQTETVDQAKEALAKLSAAVQ